MRTSRVVETPTRRCPCAVTVVLPASERDARAPVRRNPAVQPPTPLHRTGSCAGDARRCESARDPITHIPCQTQIRTHRTAHGGGGVVATKIARPPHRHGLAAVASAPRRA